MTPRDVLLKAAEYIERRGLAKGAAESSDGSMCAWGAVYSFSFGDCTHAEAKRRDLVFLEALRALHVAAGLPVPELWWHSRVQQWNDAPERTQEQVIAALRAAAEQTT